MKHSGEGFKTRRENRKKRLIPFWMTALAGAIAGAVIWLVLLLLSVNFKVDTYSTGAFLLIPMTIGAVCSLVGKYVYGSGNLDVFNSACASFIFLAIAMLVCMYEGIICLMMAFPLYVIAVGISCGITNMLIDHRSRKVSFSFTVALPILAIWQAQQPVTPTELVRVSETTINATPEEIWPMLFELDSISVSSSSLLNLGFARPKKVTSADVKVGAHRECVLTTGVMNETITEIVPERKLAFKILNTPPSMKETNPFGEVHADHLTGYYECKTGQFELVALPDGRTRIIGTSYYRHKFGPAPYWNLWTNWIVREVHHSVFEEIKRRIKQ